MGNYYFLAASFPTLTLGDKPEITFEEVYHRLEVNLSKKDFKRVEVLRRFVDLQNIRLLLKDQTLEPFGNLNEKELDEALLIQDILPSYVFDFLNQFEDKQQKLRHFFGLLSKYFVEEMPKEEGFLKRYLAFEHQLRLVLLALRAKKIKADLVFQLQFEDFSDPVVAQILAQKDMEDFDPPSEFTDLKERLRACGNDPWQQFLAVNEYRFEKIEDLAGPYLFSIDWILGFVAKLMIVEKVASLSDETGKEILSGYR